MSMNQPEGNLRSGDQPRMTESHLKREEKGTGRISYVRQAQKGGMPRSNMRRTTRS